MELERSRNVKRGSLWGIIGRVISLILPFITRTVLIKTIGVDYLGLSGLFTSILNILNMTELGIGTAIVYNMYKPIADDDTDKICALMGLYKRLYRYIGVFVLVIGLSLLPFLPRLVHGDIPSDVSLYVLFLIYLSNSVVTYWLFAYKNCLLQAFQRQDIINIIALIINVAIYILQIFVLICFENYYTYVIINPILQITSNCVTAFIVSKKYPQYACHGEVSKAEKKGIFKQVTGLMMDKMALMLRQSTGNIIVSAFIGLTMVAIYTNYLYITTAIGSFFAVISSSMSAGIGNSIASDSVQKNEQDFKILNFLYLSLAYFAYIMIMCCFQPFMIIWVGEELILPTTAMILFSVMFIIDKNVSMIGQYYDAAGLWWHGKWKGFIQAIMIITLSIFGGKFFGVIGVLIANIVTSLLVNLSLTLYFLNRFYFKGSYIKHLFDHLKLLLPFIFMGLLIYFITIRVSLVLNLSLWGDLVMRGGVALVLGILVYILVYYKTSIFKQAKAWIIIRVNKNSIKNL